MTILVAPDSFKGTYTALEVAAAVSKGVRAAGQVPVELPVADGGEGTFDVLVQGLRAQRVEVEARNPWGSMVVASVGIAGKTGIVELAQASGINVHEEGYRDPFTADTYGTGTMIAETVQRGARHVLVAAGGSATTDGGEGAVRAINDAGGLHGVTLSVLSDVTTKFLDSPRIFGPQKGADTATITLLEERLDRLAESYPRDPRDVPRTGAAGGFSGGLWANFGAELVSGAESVLDAVDFDAHLEQATAVIVGEGRLDSQTGEGKIISAVLDRVCLSGRRLPVFAVVGSVDQSLGSYRDHFADIIVAGDQQKMQRAGAAIGLRLGNQKG